MDTKIDEMNFLIYEFAKFGSKNHSVISSSAV